jgi:hypothetical protein
MATAGKAPASDSIMTADKMKPLLALSKLEPVQAAVGLSSDGEGIILLDKRAKPKKVASLLRASAAKAKITLNSASLRFGRAEVDPEYDSGMVRFFINKDAPGNMRAKLVEVVKRIPYQKVEINVDPSLELEPEENDAPDVANASPALGQASHGPNAEALLNELAALARRIPEVSSADLKAGLVRVATDANAQIKANTLDVAAESVARLREALREALDALKVGIGQVVSPAGQAARPDPATLAKDLAALARRIPEVSNSDPALKARLVKLATDANVQIKTNNLNYAANFVSQLQQALQEAPGNGAQTQPGEQVSREHPGSQPPPAKASPLQIWNEAREAVNAGIADLQVVLRNTEDPDSLKIADFGFSGVTGRLQVGLQTALLDFERTPLGDRDKARARLQAAIGDFRTYLGNDPLIRLIDENPFAVDVGLRATLLPALDKMSETL